MNTWKRTIRRWIFTAVTFSLAAGYLSEHEGSLPHQWNGWVVFVGFLWVLQNLLGGIVMSIVQFTVSSSRDFIVGNTSRWIGTDEREGAKDYIKHLADSGLMTCYNLSVHTVVDVLADCALFVALVTSEHHILAGMFLVGVSLQNFFISSIKQGIKELSEVIANEGSVVGANVLE